MQEELSRHREHLELEVRKRTGDLRKTIGLMAWRENRMGELKQAIRKLRQQLIDAGMEPLVGDPLNDGSEEQTL